MDVYAIVTQKYNVSHSINSTIVPHTSLPSTVLTWLV